MTGEAGKPNGGDEQSTHGGANRDSEPRAEPKQGSILRMLKRTTGVESRILLRDLSDESGPPLTPISTQMGTSLIGTSRYHAVGELARGGVGQIWKIRDEDLGRDVAMKVLLDRHADNPDVCQRFIEEAQIGGQLQHPGIVPVYELGLMADKRPYFTMKLIKGRTLSELIQARANPGEQRAYFIEIFDRICQALAYAHARGVVHRDLKPSNIMVGSFGEVRIVDWGFAKVLARGGIDDERRTHEQQQETEGPSVISVIETIRSQGAEGSHSIAGSVLGTPAYMPPEQALGNVDKLDERSDLFSLGGILCEILTGLPPYTGNAEEQILKALQADLADARKRIDKCGADKELIAICRHLLEPGRTLRPAHAGVVAKRVGAYRAAVEERIRQAEIAEVEARAQAEKAQMRVQEHHRRLEEEQRRRRLTMALAAAVVMCFVIGGGAWIAKKNSQAQRMADTSREVTAALEEAAQLGGLARSGGPDSLSQWNKAVAAAERAQSALRAGEHDPDLDTRVAASLSTLGADRDAARAADKRRRTDSAMRERLEAIRASSGDPLEGNRTHAHYVKAFRDYGVDFAKQARDEITTALRESAIRADLLEALDDWSWVRSRLPAGAQPPVDELRTVASLVDEDRRGRELRETIARGAKDQLLILTRGSDLPGWSASALRLLANAAGYQGAADRAVAVLRTGRLQHPSDAWLNFDLAYWLTQLDPPAWDEAVDYYTAAVSLQPAAVGAWNNLGAALLETEDAERARDSLAKAVELRSDYARAQLNYGIALRRCDQKEAGLAAIRKAIGLNDEYALAHHHLGVALREAEKKTEAIAAFEKACGLDPSLDVAHQDLVELMLETGKTDEAIQFCESAADNAPKAAWIQHTLGFAILKKGNLPEALEHFRKSVKLDETRVSAWQDIGAVLWRVGDQTGAVEAYRSAVAAGPEDAKARYDLAFALHRSGDFDDAAIEYRKAVQLDPKLSAAHDDYGTLCWAQGNRTQALDCYRRGFLADPKAYNSASNFGWTLGTLRSAAVARTVHRDLTEGVEKANSAAFFAGLARALRQMGEFDEALRAATDALRSETATDFTHQTFGRIAAWAERSDAGALQRYRRLVPEATKDQLDNFWTGLAYGYHERGRYADRLRCFETALEQVPGQGGALLNVAYANRDLYRFDEAERRALECLAHEPYNIDAYTLLGHMAGRHGGLEHVRSMWADRFEGGSPIFEALYLNGAGYGLFQAGDHAGARELLLRATGLHPALAYPYANLAKLEQKCGRIDAAIEAATEAIRRNPGVGTYHDLLAQLLASRGDGRDLLERQQQLSGRDPARRRGTLHTKAGDVFENRGKFDLALRLYEQARDINPYVANPWLCIGYQHELRGRRDKALEAYEEARRIAPASWEAPGRMCRVLVLEGRLDEAIERGEKALASSASSTSTRLWLGRALIGKRRFADAQRYLKEALDLAVLFVGPYTEERAGILLDAAGRAAELGDRLDEVLRGQRKPSDAKEAIAWAYLAHWTGHYATAVRLFDDALGEAPGGPHHHTAACAAVRAARGEGEGIEKFSEGTRRRWRSKAVDWLLADEAVKRATFDADPIGYRQRTRIHILRWHIDPALQTLRKPTEDDPDREKLVEFWDRVAQLADRHLATEAKASN